MENLVTCKRQFSTPKYLNLVARSIMESAGITPEEDLQEKPLAASATNPPSTPSPGAEPEAGSDRLSIFEDFLDKLDKGGKEKPDSEEDQDKE